MMKESDNINKSKTLSILVIIFVLIMSISRIYAINDNVISLIPKVYNPGESCYRGNSYLSSAATETKNGQTLPRATVNNCSAGTLCVLSGEIVCSTQSAVSNSGTMIVGNQDGSISRTNPEENYITAYLENNN